MKLVTNKNESKLSRMLSIIKVAIIAFISIIIYINLPKYWSDLNIKNNCEFNLYTTGFMLCVTGVCYIAFFIINHKKSQILNSFIISWLLENIFFITIISLPIYLPTAYEDEYKYLYLLLIISSVIQYGSRYGIITSYISSFFILGEDLLYAPLVNGINRNFEKDLILVGIFILVAWTLGYYINMEGEKNEEKDATLNILNTKLEEREKQKRNIESLLCKNKICYDLLLENSLNAIIVHKEGIIIYGNESAAKLLGYKNSIDLYGENFYNHYSNDSRLNVKQKYIKISNDTISKTIKEETIINCNGDSIPVRNTSSFFTYKEEPSIMTLLSDITAEKKVETLEQDVAKNLKLLNETREFNSLIMDFFINMSHEIKTPVNVIYVAIQTIDMYLNNCKDDEMYKCKIYTKIMKQNCQRMIRLIKNLSDITKLEWGSIKLNKRNDNIVSVIEDIVQSVVSYVKSKDIEIIFDTNVEEKIIGFDHDMIERIMLNLISNAFKYSDSKGHIYVNLIDKKSSIVIKVKDEGKGIPQNKLDVIFERFGQVNSSLSRECEGTGIGLYLVKSFTEMHAGKVNVISEEGKGSEFSIELPAELVNDKEYVDKALFKTNVDEIQIEFSDIYSIKN